MTYYSPLQSAVRSLQSGEQIIARSLSILADEDEEDSSVGRCSVAIN